MYIYFLLLNKIHYKINYVLFIKSVCGSGGSNRNGKPAVLPGKSSENFKKRKTGTPAR